MPKTDDGTPAVDGLMFSAARAVVPSSALTMQVRMDQSGSKIELRDAQNERVLCLEGPELDTLHRTGQLDVSRPDRLKESVVSIYNGKSTDPRDPKTFKLDLSTATPEAMRPQLVELIAWIDQHTKDKLAVISQLNQTI